MAIIHSLTDARRILNQAHTSGMTSILLESSPLAAAFGGALWFKALLDQAQKEFPMLIITGILDCGDHPGFALEALQAGLKHLRVNRSLGTQTALKDIAESYGACLLFN